MILDGNQRGGARDLAIHLMKPENEHIEIHEIRGFMADTVMGALREAEAISRGTKCIQHLYSLSLSPPETADVPVSAFENAIDRIEEKLGMTGHSRVIVFHEKNGRRHAHCVWSRINADTMTAIRMSHDRRKLADVSRQLYMEHGWKMPDGLIDPELRNPLNFDRKEWFQAKRAGRDPRDIKNAFQQCWAASDSGRAFRSALEERGYWLAQGDRRAVVALDIDGNVYAVARRVGLKTRDVVVRMNGLRPLPTAAEAQEHISGLVREKLAGFIESATDEFAKSSQTLEGQRFAMVERHRNARQQQQAEHDARALLESRQRAERFRKGLPGLWDRVTGKYVAVRKQNEMEASANAERDATEKQLLVRGQLKERCKLQAEIRSQRQAQVRSVTGLYRELASLGDQYDGKHVRRQKRHQQRRLSL